MTGSKVNVRWARFCIIRPFRRIGKNNVPSPLWYWIRARALRRRAAQDARLRVPAFVQPGAGPRNRAPQRRSLPRRRGAEPGSQPAPQGPRRAGVT